MTARRRTTKKNPLLIVLKNLSIDEVLCKYYDDDEEDNTPTTLISINESGQVCSSGVTRSNIHLRTPQKQGSRKNKRSMIFMNQYKNQSRMYAIMIDITQNGALPRMTNKPCWWCRSSFTSIPVGCPIRYNKNTPGSEEAKNFEAYLKSLNIAYDGSNDFFETEGIFCTLSCTKAYILDQMQRTSGPKYRDSLLLLNLIKFKTDPQNKDEIVTAPSWKLIDEWGGHLTPKQYRDSFGLIEYKETINMRRPLLYSTSQYFQEKRIKV